MLAWKNRRLPLSLLSAACLALWGTATAKPKKAPSSGAKAKSEQLPALIEELLQAYALDGATYKNCRSGACSAEEKEHALHVASFHSCARDMTDRGCSKTPYEPTIAAIQARLDGCEAKLAPHWAAFIKSRKDLKRYRNNWDDDFEYLWTNETDALTFIAYGLCHALDMPVVAAGVTEPTYQARDEAKQFKSPNAEIIGRAYDMLETVIGSIHNVEAYGSDLITKTAPEGDYIRVWLQPATSETSWCEKWKETKKVVEIRDDGSVRYDAICLKEKKGAHREPAYERLIHKRYAEMVKPKLYMRTIIVSPAEIDKATIKRRDGSTMGAAMAYPVFVSGGGSDESKLIYAFGVKL